MNTSMFPPLPPSDGLHPLVVHFPIALLLSVPVFIVAAMAWKSQSKGMLLAALMLAAMGTVFAALAVTTGEATERHAEAIPAAKSTLERHEDLAELARNLSIGFTAVLAAATVVYVSRAERTSRRVRLIGGCVLLLLALGPAVVIANAAHEGGRLVHVHGVHAPVGGSKGPAPAPVANGSDIGTERDED